MGMSKAELSRRSGVNYVTLVQMCAGQRYVYPKAQRAIATALGIWAGKSGEDLPPEKLFVDVGQLEN